MIRGDFQEGITGSSEKNSFFFFFLEWGERSQYKLESNTELKDQHIIMDLSVTYSSLFEPKQV